MRAYVCASRLVSNLDVAMRDMQRHVRFPVKFNTEPMHVPGIGRYATFTDQNGVLVDVLDELTVDDMPEDDVAVPDSLGKAATQASLLFKFKYQLPRVRLRIFWGRKT